MSIIKLITTVSMAVAFITMIASNQPSNYTYATTEDDGYTYPDDATEEEKEEIDEREQEAWEDAGRPGEIEDDDDNENDDVNYDNDDGLVECENGTLVETEELCEQSEASVQCLDGSSAATLDECPLDPPVICPDGGDPLPDGSCPPVICPDGGDPLPDGSCPSPPITCGRGTHLENGECVRNKDSGGGSSSSSSSSSSSASATTNVIGTEVSSCRLDGNAHGIQQKFDTAKYQACGLYPTGQVAYTDGFVLGCTQVGNTPQLCQAFVVMNTQQTQTTEHAANNTTNTSNPTSSCKLNTESRGE